MAEKEIIAKLGIQREEGYLYFVKKGGVWRSKKGEPEEKLADLGVEQDLNYLYSLDGNGDVIRVARGGAKPAAATTAAPKPEPVTFATAFAPLAKHVGRAVFFTTDKRHGELGKGSHPITVFDWTKLDEESRDMLVESQILELVEHHGEDWHKRFVPVALVGGESHPVPADELDQQSNGVLLVDLKKGGAVVLVDDPGSDEPFAIAATTRELTISNRKTD